MNPDADSHLSIFLHTVPYLLSRQKDNLRRREQKDSRSLSYNYSIRGSSKAKIDGRICSPSLERRTPSILVVQIGICLTEMDKIQRHTRRFPQRGTAVQDTGVSTGVFSGEVSYEIAEKFLRDSGGVSYESGLGEKLPAARQGVAFEQLLLPDRSRRQE